MPAPAPALRPEAWEVGVLVLAGEDLIVLIEDTLDAGTEVIVVVVALVPLISFSVAGPAVPSTVAIPTMTAGRKVPFIPDIEKRLEKLITVPPVAAEMILRNQAFVTSAPSPVLITPVT